MQEEVENRTVSLAISAAKLTGNVLKSAVSHYLAYRKEKRNIKNASKSCEKVKPSGKQTVKELVGQNQGVSNIEVTGNNIGCFDKVARKYGVDYAVMKEKITDKPRFLVFFKARDADAITAAFTEFTRNKEKKHCKPSVVKRIRDLKQVTAPKEAEKVRNKDKRLER